MEDGGAAKAGSRFLVRRDNRRWWTSGDPEVHFNGGEHLAEYVLVIIGRDNDRVAASCLWRDCRSCRRSLGHVVRGWLLRATGSISSSTRRPGLEERKIPSAVKDASLTAERRVFDIVRKTNRERIK